jgi:hypothetical protein
VGNQKYKLWLLITHLVSYITYKLWLLITHLVSYITYKLWLLITHLVSYITYKLWLLITHLVSYITYELWLLTHLVSSNLSYNSELVYILQLNIAIVLLRDFFHIVDWLINKGIITWCFSYWPSYRSSVCCIGVRLRLRPIQQTSDLLLGQYEKHHVIIL